MKLFRTINRYFRDAGKSVIRNFSLSLASISCITITLIVVALSIVLSFNINKMTENVRSNISIVVFLNGEFNYDEDKETIEKQFAEIENINTLTFKSKKEYAEETKEYDSSFELIVDGWTDDTIPLFDSYIITVKDIEIIDDTANSIKKITDVYTVKYGEEYIGSVVKIFNALEKGCISGVIALILVTAFLIANTIKLAIYSRKTEVEIMRLVGASNMSIKVPFIIEGSFIGLLGSIIPIIITGYGYNSLYNYLGGYPFTASLGKLVEPFPFIFWTGGILLLIGILVGMFGSYQAVKKYLKI